MQKELRQYNPLSRANVKIFFLALAANFTFIFVSVIIELLTRWIGFHSFEAPISYWIGGVTAVALLKRKSVDKKTFAKTLILSLFIFSLTRLFVPHINLIISRAFLMATS